MSKGIPVARSSDPPVTYVDFNLQLYGVLARKTMTGQSCFSEDTVDILGAIRMYTYNGAYAMFQEHIKGSLEPGKLADIVVLSGNILRMTPDEVRDLEVDLTFCDGGLVYERK